MHTPIFQVDAFTTHRFAGNPAAVLVLTHCPDDKTMQAIAAENNLAETAFLVPEDGNYHLRWFTPTMEVPLCGHATLASASVVMERLEPQRRMVTFNSASGPCTGSATVFAPRRRKTVRVKPLVGQEDLTTETPRHRVFRLFSLREASMAPLAPPVRAGVWFNP